MRNNAEPPSCLRTSLFLIGQNGQGNWVVQDQTGVRGGLFVDRTEALKFARSENGNQLGAVLIVGGILELDMTGKPAMPHLAQPVDGSAPERRAA
jgi:hypothetical protein